MSLVRADAITLPFADDSVDLIVTSPPYFALRSYTDGGEHYDGQIGSEETPRAFLDALWAVTAECKRVLKPSGSMFVNLGDKYAGSGGHNNAGLSSAGSTLQGSKQQDRTGMTADERRAERERRIGGGGGARRDAALRASRREAPDRYNQAGDVPRKSLMGLPWLYANGCTGALAGVGGADPGLNLTLRAEIVWSKPNGMPESVTDRVRRTHEQWFHLTKSPTYFGEMDDLRGPHADTTVARAADHRAPTAGRRDCYPPGTRPQAIERIKSMHPNGALPGSVWSISTEPLVVPEHLGVDHFAAFPTEWPRRFILGWCPPKLCRGCSCPIVESDHGTSTTPMRTVRRPDPGGTHHGPGREAPSAQAQPVLQQEVLGHGDRSEPGVDQGLRDDDEGLHRPTSAGSPDGGPDRVRAGAPTGDGGADRTDADGGRGGASPERGPSGQPAGEPGAAGEAEARQEVGGDQAAPHRVPLLRSRGAEHQGCPRCGETETRPAVVLDVFGGTGTTAMVANALGRYGISVDLSADYLRLARWRIYESGHARKAVARTWQDRQGALL